MPNLLKTEIIDNNKYLLVLDTINIKPAQGRLDSVYYIKSESKSYLWNYDTEAYVQLSANANDLLFFNRFSNFPNPIQVSQEDSLFIAEDINYVYKYDTTTNKYVYVTDVSSLTIQLVVPIKVKYAVPPISFQDDILTDKVYTTGFDHAFYLELNNKKVYISLNMLFLYFLPADGRLWSDILNPSLIPVDPTINSELIDLHTLRMLRAMFDNNSNNIVDNAENANTLQGRSAQYFLNEIDTRIGNTLGNKVKLLTSEW